MAPTALSSPRPPVSWAPSASPFGSQITGPIHWGVWQMHALMLMLMHGCPMQALPLLGVQYLTLTLERWKGLVWDLGMRQRFALFSFFVLKTVCLFFLNNLYFSSGWANFLDWWATMGPKIWQRSQSRSRWLCVLVDEQKKVTLNDFQNSGKVVGIQLIYDLLTVNIISSSSAGHIKMLKTPPRPEFAHAWILCSFVFERVNDAAPQFLLGSFQSLMSHYKLIPQKYPSGKEHWESVWVEDVRPKATGPTFCPFKGNSILNLPPSPLTVIGHTLCRCLTSPQFLRNRHNLNT